MKKLSLLLMMVTPLQLIHTQEVNQKPKHTLTVEQCRADQKLWLSKLEQAPRPSGVANIGYRDFGDWATELQDCASVDPERQGEYWYTWAGAVFEQLMRLQQFTRRHNLGDQFLAEDAQGKR